MKQQPHSEIADDGQTARTEALSAALEAADPVTLLLVLVQLTRDRSWLAEAKPHIHGPMSYQESLPDALKTAIRTRLHEILSAPTAPALAETPLDDALLREMMSVAAGEPVPEDYVPMMREDLTQATLAARSLHWREPPPQRQLETYPVAIIGAGMSGLAAAIQLRQAGIPFTIFEKNPTVGGTWYENTYPGCGVDTPNHFYSFAFAPNHDWSHYFAKRDELWAYFERIADSYELRPSIRFNTEIIAAQFDAARTIWRLSLRTAEGKTEEIEARIVISAVGALNRPKLPDIPGRESFAGPAFHTARWPADFDWRGKRIAMIGTGASGHQVGPTLAPDAARLTIFQRSPHWAVPNPNYHLGVSTGKKWALAHIPHYLRWYRFQLFWGFADGLHAALQVDRDWPHPQRSLNAVNERHRLFMERHIRSELRDRPDLLDKVIPDYPPYGKRILIDNHWYKMLRRPNVELVTEKIAAIEPDGIRTADGTFRPVDALVFATGFQASKMLWPMQITGREGRNLHEVWGADDARAYLGTTVPGFPNFFILLGPNTGLAHGGNQIFMSECQVRYIMLALRDMIESGARTIECRQDVHDRYNAEIDRLHDNMVWTHKGMTNWYRNPQGRVFAVSPWRLVQYWAMTSHFDREDYAFG